MKIDENEIDKMIDKIINHYGKEHQRMKACEELAELQVALFHDYIDDIKEEVADVYIMLEQIVKIYGIKDITLGSEIERKLERTISRINDN